MAVRSTHKKKSNAKEVAAKAREQGFDATIHKKKNKRYAVSVTR